MGKDSGDVNVSWRLCAELTITSEVWLSLFVPDVFIKDLCKNNYLFKTSDLVCISSEVIIKEIKLYKYIEN